MYSYCYIFLFQVYIIKLIYRVSTMLLENSEMVRVSL